MTDIVNGLLVRDQRVLMAHRSPLRKNYPGSWSFPGGHVEAGETFDQALARELSEEIGVIAKAWSFLRCFDDVSSDLAKTVTFHFFKVEEWEGSPTNIGDEHTEIRWIELADAIKMEDLTFVSYVELFESMTAT